MKIENWNTFEVENLLYKPNLLGTWCSLCGLPALLGGFFLSSWTWVLPFCSVHSPFWGGVLWFIYYDWQGFMVLGPMLPSVRDKITLFTCKQLPFLISLCTLRDFTWDKNPNPRMLCQGGRSSYLTRIGLFCQLNNPQNSENEFFVEIWSWWQVENHPNYHRLHFWIISLLIWQYHK